METPAGGVEIASLQPIGKFQFLFVWMDNASNLLWQCGTKQWNTCVLPVFRTDMLQEESTEAPMFSFTKCVFVSVFFIGSVLWSNHKVLLDQTPWLTEQCWQKPAVWVKPEKNLVIFLSVHIKNLSLINPTEGRFFQFI